ncbi:hypothetical protein DFP73DRAFT_524996 [Morchella snyderi]|nr:hypothetical protein DFP73DRAFT_524996 [Morchella snyderi]
MPPTPDLHRTDIPTPNLLLHHHLPTSASTPAPTPTPTTNPLPRRPFSEPRNPPLTPPDNAHLESLHRTLDTLLSPATPPVTVTTTLTAFRHDLDTPHYLLPVALLQRTSTLHRKIRATNAALAHANRVSSRLERFHATLLLQRQQQQAPTTSTATTTTTAQRLVEVLGGSEQYANVLDAGVLADVVWLRRAAEREAAVLEGRLRVVRRALDGFWAGGMQGKGDALWGVFVLEAEVRVAAVNLWAVEEANRVWVMRVVGRRGV